MLFLLFPHIAQARSLLRTVSNIRADRTVGKHQVEHPPVCEEAGAPEGTLCCWTEQHRNKSAGSASTAQTVLRPCSGPRGNGSEDPQSSGWLSIKRSPEKSDEKLVDVLIINEKVESSVSTWLERWFSLATMARRSLMVISKSCRTGASAGLAPPAHFRRCSMLASSDTSFSWEYKHG